MIVELIKDCDRGKAGDQLSGPEIWRLCFPVKGCRARPVDAEAIASVQAEIDTTKGSTRDRLVADMTAAGVLGERELPVKITTPAKLDIGPAAESLPVYTPPVPVEFVSEQDEPDEPGTPAEAGDEPEKPKTRKPRQKK